uniref:Phospholipid scramblase n=1 Tax=Heterorhabditis bacteriophora TaxID=37862 RepID=A0A1I7XRT0_HETBA
MSVDVAEILENAKKEQQMEVTFDDDVSLSLLSYDSQSSICDTSPGEGLQNRRKSNHQIDFCDLHDTLRTAEKFMDSDEFKIIFEDRVTINGQWEKMCFCCTTAERKGKFLLCICIYVSIYNGCF